MGACADCERNRGEGPSAAPRAHGPELLSGAPLWGRGASRGGEVTSPSQRTGLGWSMPCQRGESPTAAHRAHGPELLSGAPLWGRGASRERGVRREAACAVLAWRVRPAVIGARHIGRLSHIS